VRVRFEPIGEVIECGSSEAVLDAAFRQGYNLAHGCREGQCSACKCFLLEGEVALKPYSTFALSDAEQTNGYTLMCRAMPEQDLVVELLHYDPDNYRLAFEIRDGTAVVSEIESLTDEFTRLVLDAPGFRFAPGQYVELHIDGSRRSFSMANTDPGRIELIVKRYPGGRFSGRLDGKLRPGDRIEFTGPYGSLHVRDGEGPIAMVAGGSGIAPILSLLRALDAGGCRRSVRLFFGARTPFCVEDLERLKLADFCVVYAGGRRVLELVAEQLGAGELQSADVYMCGPPPMLETAQAMLARCGIDERRIFQDKFTVAADADPRRSLPSRPAPLYADSERNFSWFAPSKRRATLYEDVTIDTQPSIHRHLTRGWPVSFEDGRGTWDGASTALCSSDWYAFRDPGEQWERPFYQLESALEEQIDAAIRSALDEGLIADFSAQWVEFLRRYLQLPAFVEHGLWLALATAARDCLSDSVATCVCLQAAMKQRSAQAILLYAMELESDLGHFSIQSAREAFERQEPLQPMRRFLERLSATRDWGEVIVAANLCFEPVVGTLLRRELGTRAAAASGDTVTPVLARAATREWDWARGWTIEFVRFLVEDARFGGSNRRLIVGWVRDWLSQAEQAALALAPLTPAGVDLEQARRSSDELLDSALERRYSDELPDSALERRSSDELPDSALKRRPQRHPDPAGQPASARAAVAPVGEPVPETDGTYDYVGIVMARSAEGDAVAGALRRRHGVVVQEQPAFWDIRAPDRLVIGYDEVSAALGYEIDAYSIQHEMSTHYGRMVATDHALMLFSDPIEAMEHLMA
jgi:NAD(P)H-flavin reductase/ferredoxin